MLVARTVPIKHQSSVTVQLLPGRGPNEPETFKNTFPQRGLDKFGFIEAWAKFPSPFLLRPPGYGEQVGPSDAVPTLLYPLLVQICISPAPRLAQA